MTDKPTVPAPTTPLTESDAFKAVAAKYGISKSDIAAPMPVVVGKVNFDQLCTRTDAVVDPANGKTLVGIEGHSGPLMFIKGDEYSADTVQEFKTKYDKYIGFKVYTIFHPQHGETVVTSGIPTDGPTDLQLHIAKLEKGNLFQVAMYRTSGGNRLFKAVPPQPA